MHTYTQHNQGLVDDTPTKMYIYTTCYALTAAIFITQNEYLTDIKNYVKIERFVTKVNSFWALAIVAKLSVLDVSASHGYVSEQ